MAVQQKGRKVYKSMQGKQVDMDLLRQKNELTPAVGNARVNARGDELGPGGKIIRKREDVMADYYRDNPNVVADEQPVAKKAEPVEAVVNETPVAKKATKKVEKETVVEDEWVEDDDGNFVKRGD
jgi:hypothetical protein|tara:strand:- start:65 stop:439 length:375 start_codon:yes stop_codon:yes gene_type:complete